MSVVEYCLPPPSIPILGDRRRCTENNAILRAAAVAGAKTILMSIQLAFNHNNITCPIDRHAITDHTDIIMKLIWCGGI